MSHIYINHFRAYIMVRFKLLTKSCNAKKQELESRMETRKTVARKELLQFLPITCPFSSDAQIFFYLKGEGEHLDISTKTLVGKKKVREGWEQEEHRNKERRLSGFGFATH